MIHPLIMSLQRIETLTSSLNILVHLMASDNIPGGNLAVLDDAFEDVLCRVENVRLKLETGEFEDEL